MNPTDEQLLRRLLRQVKILNFMIISSVLIFLVMFVVAGIFAYAAMQKVQSAQNSLTSVENKASDSLDIRNELCSGSGSLAALIKSQSDVCN